MVTDSILLDRIIGKTVIRILPPGKPVPAVDAIVEEQDTNLLLGKLDSIEELQASYPVLVKEMEQQKPRSPGNVIVHRTLPKRFISIVYDIESEPVCRVEWVTTAFNNILEKCVTFRINSIAMPLPGVAYGDLGEQVSMDMILRQLRQRRERFPRQVWLFSP